MEIVFNFSNADRDRYSEQSRSVTSTGNSNATNSSQLLAKVSSGDNCFHSSSTYLPNETNIDYLNELFKEKFNDATVIISVVILILINLIVIAGNILVILSVFISAKLRTVTNFFIVSLAVADFLVGIAVLPYSLTLEILDTWIFGEIWCRGWLVIDVWMCTASILNLCAISVDRYLAVTQPVRYRSLMTAKRAKFIIAAVWIMSFIICFPLLVVQTKEASLVKRTNLNRQQHTTSSFPYQLSSILLEPPPSLSSNTPNAHHAYSLHEPAKEYGFNTSSKESVLESNIQIASQPFNSTRNRVPQYKLKDSFANNSLPTLPKPNSSIDRCKLPTVQCALFRNKSYVIYSAFGSFYIPMFVMIFFYWRIYLVAIRTTRALKRGYRTTKSSGDGTNEERLTLRIHRGYATDDNLGDKCTTTESEPHLKHKNTQASTKQSTRHKTFVPITIYKASRSSKPSMTVGNLSIPSSGKCNTLSPGDIVELNGKNRRNSPGCQSTLSLPSSSSPCSSREGSAKSNKVVIARLSKRTSKYQAKRFQAETKAAKTVGIIVGGFIVCWLPFFTVYLTEAFCEDCISELLFSIFFWLGYCNSMINPCIYGLFSRDFRRAFRNILCRCKFSEETSVSSLIRQIHMPTFFEDMPEEMTKQESQEY